MRSLLTTAAVLVLICGGCSSKKDLAFNNPADPQAQDYVGHEVLSPDDPINVPSVTVKDAPSEIKINTAYTYVASASDPNVRGLVEGRIVSWYWNFGDGTIVEDAGDSLAHTYTTAGNRTIRVIVKDDDGNTAVALRTLLITNHLPVVGALPGYTIKINVHLTLEGIASDIDGRIVKYEWDLDGDGTFEWSSDWTSRLVYTYLTPGERTITFRATDDDGNADSTSCDVVVTDDSPIASAGGPYAVKINVPLAFDGNGSDPDGSVILFEWDFDGDGTYDWSSATSADTVHTFTSRSDHVAYFRVTDDDSNATVASAHVEVTDHSPSVSLAESYTIKMNVETSFTAIASDPDGQIVRYEWDFDGDGTWDFDTTGTATAKHVYTATGIYALIVRVTDDDGNSNPTGATVEVIHIYDLAQTVFRSALTGPSATVRSVAVSSDGQYVASGWTDGSARVWRISDWTLIQTINAHSVGITAVAFMPDGRLVTGSYDATIKMWNVDAGTLDRTLSGHTDAVTSVTVSLDGSAIISGSFDSTMRVWRPTLTSVMVQTYTGHASTVRSVAISPDGELVATASYDNDVRVWNVNTGSLVRRLTGHTDHVMSVAFNNDGTRIVSASKDKTVKLWNVANWGMVRTFTGSTEAVNSAIFSNDREFIIGGGEDKAVRIWRISDGVEINTLNRYASYVYSLAITPESRYIFSGLYQAAAVWESPE
jgi:WD40 repeat protein